MNHSISTLHYLTQDLPHINHEALAEEVCSAGIQWLQLRVKNQSMEKWEAIAERVQEICSKHNTTFIVNDNVQIARKLNADGVHLGKTDMHPAEARAILGAEKIIGGTANHFEDILRLAEAKVDYIGLGPFRFTNTKEKLSPLLGTEGYQKVISMMEQHNIKIPVIAIGGIKLEDIATLMKMKIHGIAVSSAINLAENRKKAAESWLFTLNNL